MSHSTSARALTITLLDREGSGDEGDLSLTLGIGLPDKPAQTIVDVAFTGEDFWEATLRVRPGFFDASPAFFATHLECACAAWAQVCALQAEREAEFYSQLFYDDQGEPVTLTLPAP